MTSKVKIAKRGCGWPKAGGVYAHVPVGKDGKFQTPIWNFLLCPTVPIEDPNSYGISAIDMALISRGVTNAEGKEIFDIYDWIGEGSYPNPMDWIFEIDKLGFHQKVKTAQIAKLVPESNYFAIHPRGWINNPRPYIEKWQTSELYPKCPANHEPHIKENKVWVDSNQMCTGLLLNDTVKGTPISGRQVTRTMPSFEYQAWSPAVDDATYTPAIFFRLPIGVMAEFLVYEDSVGNTHEAALKELEALDKKLQRVKVVKI